MKDNCYNEEEFDEVDGFANKYSNLVQRQIAEEERGVKRIEKQKLAKGIGLDGNKIVGNANFKAKLKKLNRKTDRGYNDY